MPITRKFWFRYFIKNFGYFELVLNLVMNSLLRYSSLTTVKNYLQGVGTHFVDVHDVHNTRIFRFHYFSRNFGTFEFKILLLKTDIFAESFHRMNIGELCPSIKLFCVFNAYPAIHYMQYCQEMGEPVAFKLALFFQENNLYIFCSLLSTDFVSRVPADCKTSSVCPIHQQWRHQ